MPAIDHAGAEDDQGSHRVQERVHAVEEHLFQQCAIHVLPRQVADGQQLPGEDMLHAPGDDLTEAIDEPQGQQAVAVQQQDDRQHGSDGQNHDSRDADHVIALQTAEHRRRQLQRGRGRKADADHERQHARGPDQFRRDGEPVPDLHGEEEAQEHQHDGHHREEEQGRADDLANALLIISGQVHRDPAVDRAVEAQAQQHPVAKELADQDPDGVTRLPEPPEEEPDEQKADDRVAHQHQEVEERVADQRP